MQDIAKEVHVKNNLIQNVWRNVCVRNSNNTDFISIVGNEGWTTYYGGDNLTIFNTEDSVSKNIRIESNSSKSLNIYNITGIETLKISGNIIQSINQMQIGRVVAEKLNIESNILGGSIVIGDSNQDLNLL